MVEEICTGNIGYYLSRKWKPGSFYQKTNIISFFGYIKEEILDNIFLLLFINWNALECHGKNYQNH